MGGGKQHCSKEDWTGLTVVGRVDRGGKGRRDKIRSSSWRDGIVGSNDASGCQQRNLGLHVDDLPSAFNMEQSRRDKRPTGGGGSMAQDEPRRMVEVEVLVGEMVARRQER